jgi:hypothetical protein
LRLSFRDGMRTYEAPLWDLLGDESAFYNESYDIPATRARA